VNQKNPDLSKYQQIRPKYPVRLAGIELLS
jgi:hypothetical protein